MNKFFNVDIQAAWSLRLQLESWDDAQLDDLRNVSFYKGRLEQQSCTKTL